MEKEHFINEVLNSTASLRQVRPGDDLYTRIEQNIQGRLKVSAATIWWVAASVAILVALNIAAFASAEKTSENQTTAAFAATLDNSNQLY